MASFSSWGALKKAMQDKMRSALSATLEESYSNLETNLSNFYSGTEPVMYVRTGQYGASARKLPIAGSGDSLSCAVYMDGGYGYSTGEHPSGYTVFQWAEVGSHHIIGKPGTWQTTEQDIQVAIQENFSKAFS